MPTELELCAVSAVIAALLSGGITYTVTHKIDGAALAHEQVAHANDIARINAASAQLLADAVAKGQAAQGRVTTLQQQFDNEVAQHAKDSLDYRAKLLAGTQRVRVHTTGCGHSGTSGQSASAPASADDSTGYGFLSPEAAASAVQVADEADQTAAQLRALQQYVTELQNDGYVSK